MNLFQKNHNIQIRIIIKTIIATEQILPYIMYFLFLFQNVSFTSVECLLKSKDIFYKSSTYEHKFYNFSDLTKSNSTHSVNLVFAYVIS